MDMAEAIVGPLLSKLQEVVVKEAKALAEVGGDIDKLRDKLMWLHALVHEADLRGRHDGNRLVRVLAFQIRDAGFDVEDAVDHFYLRGSLSRRFGRHNWWRIAKEFIFHFWTHLRVRVILSRTIRSVNVRLEEIIGNNSTYTLSQSGGSGDGKTWRASRAIPPMRTDWYNLRAELYYYITLLYCAHPTAPPSL